MRMRLADRANARSSARADILFTRTLICPPRDSTKPGSTPNWVIVGPRLSLDHLCWCPKRGQGVLDQARPLAIEFIIERRIHRQTRGFRRLRR